MSGGDGAPWFEGQFVPGCVRGEVLPVEPEGDEVEELLFPFEGPGVGVGGEPGFELVGDKVCVDGVQDYGDVGAGVDGLTVMGVEVDGDDRSFRVERDFRPGKGVFEVVDLGGRDLEEEGEL